MRRFKDASKVSLRFHSSRPAPLLLGQPHVLSAAHESTSVENGEQILRDVINGSVAVDTVEQPLFFIPSGQRRGLLVIRRKAIQDRRLVVIRSPLFLVVTTATPLSWDGIERVMVNGSAIAAGRASTNTLHDALIGHFDGEHMRDLGHVSEGAGLGYGSWKTVEHHAVGGIRFLNSVLDESEDDIVRNKFASVHVALGLQANVGPSFDGCAQHVARGNLGQTGVFHDALGLRAFSCAGWTKQDDAAHGGWTASTLSILTNQPCRFSHSWP